MTTITALPPSNLPSFGKQTPEIAPAIRFSPVADHFTRSSDSPRFGTGSDIPPDQLRKALERRARKEARKPQPGRYETLDLNGPDVVTFFKTSDEYGAFSNFSRHGFDVDGRHYRTAEHYYQSKKFQGTDELWAEAIRQAGHPKLAAMMGRDSAHRDKIRPDWETAKVEAMREALDAKFRQNAELQALLLGTGDKVIVEANANDPFWGIGAKQKGRNVLGELLMEVRDGLRPEKSQPGKN